jgi:hypothetical protein
MKWLNLWAFKKKHLLSDLQVVCELLEAAGNGAYHICIENLRLMTDPIPKAEYQSRLTQLHDRSRELINLAKASILRSGHKFLIKSLEIFDD